MMIVKTAEFMTSAAKSSQYPAPGPPEIAFAGRSNVGKSSLINVLVNRRRLVKTSSTPGRTQLLNFFDINGEFIFVDLPGYGYAKAPAAVRKSWGPMIETYLKTRPCLKGVVAILDIRREPREDDLNLLGWLDHFGISRIVALAKSDKLSKSGQKKRLDQIAGALETDPSDLIPFSAKTRAGKDRVWEGIRNLLDQGPGKPKEA
ncbi:putative GTP-binding protein EngB [Candidatus Desulfarcum epimagneticum]|uniref:Probable GTP-binding protein EngB n=1 Tax=uncultured Desulfobacteraceae bacterium TaxID=218296 RepID=A0A484HC78_9BACT|nr:putative GTP-binding protein EngB [uncultured Desulfobacteraceae bacterium]